MVSVYCLSLVFTDVEITHRQSLKEKANFLPNRTPTCKPAYLSPSTLFYFTLLWESKYNQGSLTLSLFPPVKQKILKLESMLHQIQEPIPPRCYHCNFASTYYIARDCQ